MITAEIIAEQESPVTPVGFFRVGQLVTMICVMQEVTPPTKPPMLADRIAKCVKCGYSFQGLPAQAGACPECGLAYDEHSRVFQIVPKQMGKSMKLLIYLPFLPSGLWWAFQSWTLLGIFWALGSLLVFGGMFFILEFIMWRFRRRSISSRPWVGCFAEGFFLNGENTFGTYFYPWSDFSRYRVTGRHSSFGVALRLRHEKPGLAANNELNICGVFNDRAELADFIKIIEHQLSKKPPGDDSMPQQPVACRKGAGLTQQN